jgi:hypothetical protein
MSINRPAGFGIRLLASFLDFLLILFGMWNWILHHLWGVHCYLDGQLNLAIDLYSLLSYNLSFGLAM